MACPLVKDSPTFSIREWIVIGPARGEPISTGGDSGSFFVRKPETEAAAVRESFFGGAHATSPGPSESGGEVDMRDENRNERVPVVGVMFGGALVNWPQSMQGDGAVVTREQKEADKTYHLTLSEPDPLYGAEITIITPASTILGWMAEDLGRVLEFRQPM